MKTAKKLTSTKWIKAGEEVPPPTSGFLDWRYEHSAGGCTAYFEPKKRKVYRATFTEKEPTSRRKKTDRVCVLWTDAAELHALSSGPA